MMHTPQFFFFKLAILQKKWGITRWLSITDHMHKKCQGELLVTAHDLYCSEKLSQPWMKIFLRTVYEQNSRLQHTDKVLGHYIALAAMDDLPLGSF